VNGQTSVLMYFFQAGWVVKSVMFILLATSLLSWTLILQKAWFFKQAKRQVDRFTRRFWESNDLSKLYNDIDARYEERHGVAAIFYAGFKEFLRSRQHGGTAIEPIQRVMQISYAKEAEQLEQHLPFFASVGSISPYVGLFGTVWGIMTSFQALGHAQQAAIATVAPGISEALVATALGLFTAIPAVIAYNRYTTKANALLSRFDLFQEELIALIEQQTPPSTKGYALP
jgi:biopolymer transport protein TolQ